MTLRGRYLDITLPLTTNLQAGYSFHLLRESGFASGIQAIDFPRISELARSKLPYTSSSHPTIDNLSLLNV